MIKAIIIDDEMHCLKTLSMLLKEYCPDVQVVKQCDNAEDGIEAVKKLKPDLVFLDIEMPHMNGFEMLEKFSEISFALIFTTGYDQYAIKAFRFSALDYLLKPIEPKELKKAVEIGALYGCFTLLVIDSGIFPVLIFFSRNFSFKQLSLKLSGSFEQNSITL